LERRNMGRDYIPEADSGALDWMRVFSQGISSAPHSFQLAPADAETIRQAVDAFAAAMSVASSPSTRTKSSVQKKDEARNSAKSICRLYAKLIKFNAGISDSSKISIGVPPEKNSRTRRNVPGNPLLKVLGATPAQHVLMYHDSATPTRRAMPFGATRLQLFVAIGDGPSEDVSDARFFGSFTSTPMRVKHDPANAGKTATYFGRWGSQRGEFGPWSLPISFTIAN
jgi:hypothetical protein